MKGSAAVMLARTANSVSLQATAAQPRFLVFSDTYYPGWQAKIGEESVAIYQTNVALRGLIVPPGSHTITMTFRPTTYVVGTTLSLTTAVVLLLWLGLAGLTRFRRRSRNAAPSPGR